MPHSHVLNVGRSLLSVNCYTQKDENAQSAKESKALYMEDNKVAVKHGWSWKAKNPWTGGQMEHDKTFRGNASQFFVAGELCRRGYSAVVTLGNTPNVDILCSNRSGTRFVHIQVKTFVPGNKTCSVGMKAYRDFGPSFIWALAGIPLPEATNPFEYYKVLLQLG